MPYDKKTYDIAYQRDHIRRIQLPLNQKTDADIIRHLEKQPSMSQYIKCLIRKDIKSPS